jgi:hypothetical protein
VKQVVREGPKCRVEKTENIKKQAVRIQGERAGHQDFVFACH